MYVKFHKSLPGVYELTRWSALLCVSSPSGPGMSPSWALSTAGLEGWTRPPTNGQVLPTGLYLSVAQGGEY